MASAMKAFKKKSKGKRKDKVKNGATLADTEEQPSLQSAFGEKSEKSQDISQQSGRNSKELPNSSKAGSSHSGGHKPGETTHKMFHSLDHPGSPDCPSLPPCPKGKSLETSDNKTTLNQKTPPARQHGLPTAKQAPSTSAALNKINHEYTNGALHTEHHSIPANTTDGKPLNSANSEMPADGATAAGISSSSSTQESPVAAIPTTTTVPPNEGESSLPSLTGRPTQVEPENTAEDTTTGQGTPQEEAVNNYEQFLVSEKIHGNKFLQDKLAVGLDRTCHRVIKTWEHLACTDEINAPLEVRLKCKINSENSCTLTLFDVLTVELEDKTVKDVIDALTRIKRNDAKKIITDVYPNAAESSETFNDFSASLDNSQLITKMATLLDQKSRVNQNWRNLGQQFKLSDERLKEIEYGQSAQILMRYLYSKKTDLTIGTFYDEVKKLKRNDVLKKLDPFIVEEGDRDKLMKDVIGLESDAMKSICVCLNNPNRVLKNWRHLAKSSVLGIPEDIYKDCVPGNLKSPTESLFEWIFADRNRLTVGQLCSALGKIDRNDLVRDLRKHFEQNLSG